VKIQGHTFLVSGGASGLGRACAARLAAAGAHVVVADVHSPSDEQRKAAGAAIEFVEADVTDERDVAAAVAAAQAGPGGLAGAVTCAGILFARRIVGRHGPHALEEFAHVVAVNLIGTFNVVRLAAAALSERSPDEEGERGVIVTTASVAAFEGQIGQAAYSASKAGVVGMTLPLARELATRGIRVMSIAPGIFETPMMAAVPDAVRESLIAQSLYPARLGRPEEFAALVEHILENHMLNGEVIRLDGAVRMGPR